MSGFDFFFGNRRSAASAEKGEQFVGAVDDQTTRHLHLEIHHAGSGSFLLSSECTGTFAGSCLRLGFGVSGELELGDGLLQVFVFSLRPRTYCALVFRTLWVRRLGKVDRRWGSRAKQACPVLLRWLTSWNRNSRLVCAKLHCRRVEVILAGHRGHFCIRNLC